MFLEERILTISVTLLFIYLIIWETRKIGNLITPFNLMTIPFLFIVNLVNWILVNYGFDKVTIRAQLIIFSALLITWFISRMLFSLFNSKTKENRSFQKNFVDEFHRFQYLIIFSSWIVIIVFIKKIYFLVQANGGFAYLGTDEFEYLISRGFTSHLLYIGYFSFIYLGFIYDKSRSKLITLITLISLGFVMFLLQIKFPLLQCLLILFFYKVIHKTIKKQLLSILYMGIIISLVFILFFIFLKLTWNTLDIAGSRTWDYLTKVFLNYLVMSPILLDDWSRYWYVKPDWAYLVVFKNVAHVIYGNPIIYDHIKLLSRPFVQPFPGIYANVATAFGPAFLVGGIYFCYAVHIFFSLIVYTFFYAFLRSKNHYLAFLNFLLLTLCMLLFFGQYFTILWEYEFIVISTVIIFMFRSYAKLTRRMEIAST